MILTCPQCATRFAVSPVLFAQGVRPVRCGRCAHQWDVDLLAVVEEQPSPTLPTPQETESVAVPPEPDPPLFKEATPPPRRRIRPGFLRRMALGASVAAFVLACGLALATPQGRAVITTMVQRTAAALYRGADSLMLRWLPEGGFTFENVNAGLRAEPQGDALVVEGVILNTRGFPRNVPELTLTALDGKGMVIKTWHLPAQQPRLDAHQRLRFRYVLAPPEGAFATINLNVGDSKTRS